MKENFIRGLFLGAALFGQAAFAAPPEGYRFLSYDEGLKTARAENKKVFLYYGRDGCGYCDRTNRESFSDKTVRERFSGEVVLVYVDTEGSRRLRLPSGERISEYELSARMNTVGTPVFMFLEPDGREITRLYGFQKAGSLLDYLSYVMDGKYAQQSFKEYQARKDAAQ